MKFVIVPVALLLQTLIDLFVVLVLDESKFGSLNCENWPLLQRMQDSPLQNLGDFHLKNGLKSVLADIAEAINEGLKKRLV